MREDILQTAAVCGGLLQYRHRLHAQERYGLPDSFWQERLKAQLKYVFGDYVVRNKITMQEHRLPYDVLEHRSELIVFTPEQLFDFLQRVGLRIIEEQDYEEHMGIPFC